MCFDTTTRVLEWSTIKGGSQLSAGLCMAAAEAGTNALLPHVLNKNFSQRGRVDNWGL